MGLAPSPVWNPAAKTKSVTTRMIHQSHYIAPLTEQKKDGMPKPKIPVLFQSENRRSLFQSERL